MKIIGISLQILKFVSVHIRKTLNYEFMDARVYYHAIYMRQIYLELNMFYILVLVLYFFHLREIFSNYPHLPY